MPEEPTFPTIGELDDTSCLALRKQFECRELAIRLLGLNFLLLSGVIFHRSFDFHELIVAILYPSPGSFLFKVIAFLKLILFLIGYGLIKLRGEARTGALICSPVLCLALPVGPCIACYIICILCDSAGASVVSRPYREVVARTHGFNFEFHRANRISLGLSILITAGSLSLFL